MVRSLLSFPDSSANRPIKYSANGARGQVWIAKGHHKSHHQGRLRTLRIW